MSYARVKQWRLDNPEKWKLCYRRAFIKKKYGLTIEQLEEMEKEQGGKCKCCHEVKRLVVDHCHTTGKIRGLLCSTCNTGLGHFRDDIEKLKLGIKYLESCA